MIQPDKIIRSFRKTLSVSVDTFGTVTVRAPMRCSEKRIFSFLREKEAWIIKKTANRRENLAALPPENLEGYVFSLLGKPCRVCLTDTRRVRYDEENGVIFLPKERARERLTAWLKRAAKGVFEARTRYFAQIMQTDYRSVGVSSARGRWGSCSANNALHYTFRLLYAEPRLIDYVVVHELAHTKHKDHSPRFWAEVEKYLPDYKQLRKRLQAHGVFLQIF